LDRPTRRFLTSLEEDSVLGIEGGNGPSSPRLGGSDLEGLLPREPFEPVEGIDPPRAHDIVGTSAAMQRLLGDITRLARTDITLLVEGETGTGKDLAAEWIHRASSRADGPYVVFDCSAVVSTLAESELFGHERGSFTGAVTSRPGAFEQANGGTLFLDELGELPRDLQPKLLRILEKHEVRRVGGQRMIPVDVRVVAATNRDLAAEAQLGRFRQDLYFRIAVAQITIPPLRERVEDIPLLIEHFLAMGRPPRPVSDIPAETREQFLSYHWPGNVRELRNAVHRLFVTPDRVLRSNRRAASSSDPGAPATDQVLVRPLRIARRQANDSFELDYLTAVLKVAGGNVSRAAGVAGVSRQMLTKLLRKHGVKGGKPRRPNVVL
jgi:transcriptional regulator with GAF, ATPase, and Fis domain